MATRKLDKSAWAAYFAAFSKPFMHGERVDYAEIRVFSPEVGAQQETTWLPLSGITYDARSDLLDVAVANLDHMIYRPAEIYVEEAGAGVISSIQIVRDDGTREVIELR